MAALHVIRLLIIECLKATNVPANTDFLIFQNNKIAHLAIILASLVAQQLKRLV